MIPSLTPVKSVHVHLIKHFCTFCCLVKFCHAKTLGCTASLYVRHLVPKQKNTIHYVWTRFSPRNNTQHNLWEHFTDIQLYFPSTRYNVVIVTATYVLPILVIGLCSSHMSVVLWCRPTVGVVTPQIARAKRKKQKVIFSYYTASSSSNWTCLSIR